MGSLLRGHSLFKCRLIVQKVFVLIMLESIIMLIIQS